MKMGKLLRVAWDRNKKSGMLRFLLTFTIFMTIASFIVSHGGEPKDVVPGLCVSAIVSALISSGITWGGDV